MHSRRIKAEALREMRCVPLETDVLKNNGPVRAVREPSSSVIWLCRHYCLEHDVSHAHDEGIASKEPCDHLEERFCEKGGNWGQQEAKKVCTFGRCIFENVLRFGSSACGDQMAVMANPTR